MTEYVRHEEEANGFTLQIIADTDASNPRTDFDEASVMVCEHGRYDLGDKDGRDKAIEAVRSSRDWRPSWDEEYTYSDPSALWEAVQRCSDIVAFPLYLYDHSGITIRMSSGGGNPFHCRWDSGMVGFIFMTKAMIMKNWMLPEDSRLTPKLKEQARSLMQGETETYDMYLTGDVWGYVIEDKDGDEQDALWGMFGFDYALEEGRGALKEYASIEPPLPLELA